MDNKIKEFIVGKQPFPEWFKGKLRTGKAKVYNNEDGELDKIVIIAATKTYEAKTGDVIMLNNRGMSVRKASDVKEEEKDAKK